MMLEARYVAQIHVADELRNAVLNEPANILHSDGTYLTYDCKKGDGTILVTDLRCVSGRDAETQLNTFNEILDDLSLANVSNNEITNTNCNNGINDNDNDNNFVSNAFLAIKNLMSNRCSVQNKFNNLFYEYRKSVIPKIIDNQEDLDVKQGLCITGVNDFYSGLHFLVGLTDQPEVSLKLWESLLFGEAKIGSLNHGVYSKGEYETLRLIGTIPKSVSRTGCEKSGRMVTFATYMKDKLQIQKFHFIHF